MVKYLNFPFPLIFNNKLIKFKHIEGLIYKATTCRPPKKEYLLFEPYPDIRSFSLNIDMYILKNHQ
jgi:hypothetical protein